MNCPSGFTNYNKTYCYIVPNGALSFSGATSSCSALNSTLLMLYTIEKFNYFTNFSKTSGLSQVWVTLTSKNPHKFLQFLKNAIFYQYF